MLCDLINTCNSHAYIGQVLWVRTVYKRKQSNPFVCWKKYCVWPNPVQPLIDKSQLATMHAVDDAKKLLK